MFRCRYNFLSSLGQLGDVILTPSPLGAGNTNDILQWNGNAWENRSDVTTGNISLTGGEIRDTNGLACIEVITGGDVEINNGDLDVAGGNLIVSGAGNYLISQSGADVLLKGSNGLAVFQLDASLNSGNGAMSWGNIAPSEDWNVLVNGSERVSFIDINGTEEVGGKDTSLTTIGDIQCGGIVWAGDGSQLGLSVKTIIAGANEIYAAPHYTNIVSTSASWVIRVQGIPSGSGDYEVDIVAGGTRGTATYQWRVDGGSWSAIQTTTYGQTLLSQGVYIGWSGTGVFDAADSFTFTADSAPTTVFNVDTATPLVTISDLSLTNNLTLGGNLLFSGNGNIGDGGAPGNNPNDGYFNGDLDIGDTLNVTGVTTLDDDLVFTGSAGEGLPYAQIYEEDGTGTLALAAQDTAYQVTLFSADGESNNATPDHTNDHITIVKAGRYYVSFGVSFSQTTAVSIEYDFHVKKNNGATDFIQVSAHRNSGGASSVGSCGASGIIDVAANDTIELWVERLDGAAVTRTITIQALQLTLFQIGGT